MFSRPVVAGLLASLMLAGCATKPTTEMSLKTSYAPGATVTAPLKAHDPIAMEPTAWGGYWHHLAGRTLTVSSLHDLKLADKEVILTFDDGPMPGKTEKILATLDQFGVKGAFMMVGEMAAAHPAIARKVLDDGNAIGSHTYRHPDLARMSFDMAIAEVVKGENAVSKAIGTDVNFFRFPYLADTKSLRSAIAQRDMIVMDVDIDSKDYFTVKPAIVLERTMEELHRRGRGIILMHDIHQRTAIMLPGLLNRLEKEGYKVVTLRYGRDAAPSNVIAMADLKMSR
ncbi:MULTISPECIES: polysaccharide deacetylase family protein [unclassified Rhizobium]|uniref:polysaccharide deacetylase family protein n=1 Tax=unclassified Rhizobium TaxID=2613769 RepID=UPI001ADB6016|nr:MULTISPECIES: polysaccharide deacetylase family protein [unclassified Rhizobium]MBO9097971.1 polysaccharide deacetylase family protein [Rhizobium sp. L58/93]MBO9133246.1 polysaccharide deacetylase family protein [Rhizobium sp. B209b/85]MBO9168122.1 polysaccharide deacetylase family protein [Rhizobium sp. L245/93]MBO9184167.1 polysaccharide deacetylase family protein [Rhizobium sp. E27B/91]QXZ84375.1 polysaccharide deacetylase family protein [Rhizobium sp. K1/93]